MDVQGAMPKSEVCTNIRFGKIFVVAIKLTKSHCRIKFGKFRI